MEVLELQGQTLVRLKSPVRKQKPVRYTLLVLAIVYVLGSLYVILTTRSHLAAVTTSQQAAIKLLERRQENIESDVNTSNEVWEQRLGSTTDRVQQQLVSLQSRNKELERRQQAIEDRMQLQNDVIGDVTVQVADARRELWRRKK